MQEPIVSTFCKNWATLSTTGIDLIQPVDLIGWENINIDENTCIDMLQRFEVVILTGDMCDVDDKQPFFCAKSFYSEFQKLSKVSSIAMIIN